MIHFNILLNDLFHGIKIQYWLLLSVLLFSCSAEEKQIVQPVLFAPAVGDERYMQIDLLTEVSKGLSVSNRISLFGKVSVLEERGSEYHLLFETDSFRVQTNSPEGRITLTSGDSISGIAELKSLEDSILFFVSRDLSVRLPDELSGLEGHDFFRLEEGKQLGEVWETFTIEGNDTIANSRISYVSQDSLFTRLETEGMVRMKGITLVGMSFEAIGTVNGWMILQNSFGWPSEMQLEWKGTVNLPLGTMNFRNSLYFKLLDP